LIRATFRRFLSLFRPLFFRPFIHYSYAAAAIDIIICWRLFSTTLMLAVSPFFFDICCFAAAVILLRVYL